MKALRLPRPSLAIALAIALLSAAALGAQTPAQNDSAVKAAKTTALPLITPRKLTFTTDEASWISLDVAPNGATIVFEILGDLYTIPIAGGSATRITSGQGWDQQPRYSPDGTMITFVSDRNGSKNVWIANADGTKPRMLTRSERINFASPIWSADGQYVIAARTGQLWMYNKDGGSGVQLTGLRAEGAAAAPHGDVTSEREEAEYREARSNARRIGQYQVAQFDRETGRTLTRSHETDGAIRQVLDRNPLTDIKNSNSIKYVMKNGRLYDGNNLNEVWPRAKPLPPQWWWKEDPPTKK